jgi:lauroyl/myristoyl acyltransferase
MDTLEIDRTDAKKRLFRLMQLEVFAERNSMLFDTCTASELEKRFTVHGLEKLDEAQQKGKGVIFATVHAGEAELFVLFLALKGYKMYGLYDSNILREANGNPLQKFAKLKDRKLTGRIGKLYAGLSRPSVFDALKENGIIGWMVDLPAVSEKRCSIVSLFNTKLAVNTSPWEVAHKTDAQLLPFVDIYDHKNDRHEVFIGDAIDLKKKVFQDLFTFYESHLRKSPESWGGWYILDLLKIKANR